MAGFKNILGGLQIDTGLLHESDEETIKPVVQQASPSAPGIRFEASGKRQIAGQYRPYQEKVTSPLP